MPRAAWGSSPDEGAYAQRMMPEETFALQALGDATGWDGHPNGRVPLTAMTRIEYPRVVPYGYPGSLSDVYMRPDAASDLLAWLAAFRAQFGTHIKVNEGYRTYEGQQYWWNYWGQDPRYAAPPGSSNHGLGQAVDFERGELTAPVLTWLRATCGEYGFQRYAAESWHFDYVRPYVPIQQPDLEEVEDMFVVRATESGIVPAGMALMISLNASHSVSNSTLVARGINPDDVYKANDPTLRIILRDHGIPEARAQAQDKADEAHSSILRRLKPISDKVGAIWS